MERNRTPDRHDGLSVAVTGHQPFLLGGYGDEVAVRLRDLAGAWLADHRPREVVSGLAAGWDTAVASAALLTGIPLVAALAYRKQASHWPAEAAEQHESFVAAASEVFVYSEEKSHGCYSRRDRWVLERSDLVLALWSGADGGTARAISHAESLGKPIVNLWKQWDSA